MNRHTENENMKPKYSNEKFSVTKTKNSNEMQFSIAKNISFIRNECDEVRKSIDKESSNIHLVTCIESLVIKCPILFNIEQNKKKNDYEILRRNEKKKKKMTCNWFVCCSRCNENRQTAKMIIYACHLF